MYGTILRGILLPLYETKLRGRTTLTRLAELERSQWDPEPAVRALSWRRMLDALAYAEKHVPFYRRRFADWGVRVRDVHDPGDLAHFPVLTKADIRAHANELVSETFRGRLHASGTGGSTGAPLRFAYDHHTYEARIAAAIRSDRWAGGDIGELEVHVWGIPLHREGTIVKMKRITHEAILRKRMLCAFDLSEERLAEIIDILARERPRIVVGYTTPLYHLARYAFARGISIPPPKGIVATAERLFEHQRDVIERAFGARVFDRYGCREVMLIAAECERHEGKHVNAENVFVELYAGGKPAAPGQPGEVIVTDLVSRSMPLIRYKNEDIATASARACPCGRGLPLLASVEGRVLDMLVGPDGQLLAGEFFPHLLKEYPNIARYQVHQDRSRALTLKLMPGDGFLPETATEIERRVRQFLGARAAIRVELVDHIPLTRGGKHRVAISEAAIDLVSVA